MPRRYVVLGTDGFGRSDTREKLRHFFEVDRYWVTVASLKALADEGVLPREKVRTDSLTLALENIQGFTLYAGSSRLLEDFETRERTREYFLKISASL